MARWFSQRADISALARMLVMAGSLSFAVLVVAALQWLDPPHATPAWSALCAVVATVVGFFAADAWMRMHGVRFGDRRMTSARPKEAERLFSLRGLLAILTFASFPIPALLNPIWNEKPIDDFHIGVAVGALLVLLATVFGAAPQRDALAAVAPRPQDAGPAT
jgi:hypothetical protein